MPIDDAHDATRAWCAVVRAWPSRETEAERRHLKPRDRRRWG